MEKVTVMWKRDCFSGKGMKSVPQRLKPDILSSIYGPTKVVP
jgi:hypothetical protein